MDEPNAKPPDEDKGRLALGGGLERAVRDDLDALRAERRLAHQDAAADLARDLEQGLSAPLALSEFSDAIDRLAGPALPTFAELEGLLASPESASGLSMDGNLLADLLAGRPQARLILKNGLLFVKNRRYSEAIEWWSLHRRDLDPRTDSLHLLLLILESLTHLWSGDAERASEVRARVRAHPLCARLGGPRDA
jgi:hypothetical protein